MSALKFRLPPNDGPVLSVVDMHTGGEPLRIVLSGAPVPGGSTLLEKRRWVLENMDWVRRVLMLEPRGHRDMYGALLVPSEEAEAQLGVLFMHNAGYSTMCGHAVIALGRFALDYGLVDPRGPETPINIHCPCGLVRAYVSYSAGRSGAVRFHSVPAFTLCTESQVDRSPTGSGVTARIALQYHKGLIQLDQTRTFKSGATDSLFTGKAVKEAVCGDYKAVIVEVSGHAHYTGTASFTLESDDLLKDGFLLK